MNSTWKSLLWKEWREQRWRLVALILLLSLASAWFIRSITSISIAAGEINSYLPIMTGFLSCYVILSACFVGMHVAGGENASQTMRFLQALPSQRWKTGLTKLLVGCVIATLPIVICFAVNYVCLAYFFNNKLLDQTIEQWRIDHLFEWLISSALSGVLGTTSLLLWMVVGGNNRSDEVRAGAVGFLICGGTLLICLFACEGVYRFNSDLGDFLQLLFPILPGGPAFIPFYYQQGTNSAGWFLILPALILSHGALLWCFLKHFGREAMPPKRAGGFEFSLLRGKGPRIEAFKSQWSAIAWKHLRETGPLAATSIAGILVIVLIVHQINKQNNYAPKLGELLAAVTMSAGFFIIIVAGIAVFLEDFAPGVNNFWRSRPVNLKVWFVVKYVVGLNVLALAFGSLLIPAYWLQTDIENDKLYWFFQSAFFATYYLTLLYSLAMTCYCLLRQPIYAAVLTFGIFFCGMLSIYKLNHLSQFTLAIVMILSLAIPITIAYLAVKHDWGWKVGR